MFKITYGWTCKNRNGAISEGGFSALRRLYGTIFLGEKFERLSFAQKPADATVDAEDMCEYFMLCKEVYDIDKDAAYYLLIEAPKLGGFAHCGYLDSAFTWYSTPQGHEYWHKLHEKLLNGNV